MRRIATLATAAVLSVATGAQPDRPLDALGAGRLVAIGDVHGAYEQFASILARAGLIDTEQRWTGARATLVVTGDYTDRGAGVRRVLDLLMALEERATKSGGQVVTLMGNHEMMNIIGDMRYVTPEIVKPFADPQSDLRRDDAWRQYQLLVATRANLRANPPSTYRPGRTAWMAAHPPGWLEYREALSARGRYGRWLRTKAIAAQLDGTIFMHAGISPDQPATVDAVNAKAREEIARYEAYFKRLVDRRLALPFFTLQEVLEVSASALRAASAAMDEAKVKGDDPDLSGFDVAILRDAMDILKIGDWAILTGEGPLWFRGYATWPEDETTRPKVIGFLDKYKVTRIVVGHTPVREARITPRFGGRVVLIDTGMLVSAYQGRPSALEIQDSQLSAIYEDGVVPLSSSSTPHSAAVR